MTSLFMSMTSPTTFFHVAQIALEMWLCDQILVTLTFIWEKLSQPQCYNNLTRKNIFYEGWSWLKMNYLGMALGMALKFYTNVAKEVKINF